MHELLLSDSQRERLLEFIARADQTFGDGTFDATADWSPEQLLAQALKQLNLVAQ